MFMLGGRDEEEEEYQK